MMITTFEHGCLTEQDFAVASDFTWLMEQVEQDLPIFNVVRKNGKWQIKVKHYLAMIGLPSGQQLQILPKIHHENLADTEKYLNLMFLDILQSQTYVNPKVLPNLTQANPNLLLKNQQNFNFLNILQQHFYQLFLTYQTNQQYQRFDENQPFLQGKLLLKQQLQYNHPQHHKFFNQIEQFVQDTGCNRLVKSTAIFLQLNQLVTMQNWQNLAKISNLANLFQASFQAKIAQELALLNPMQRQINEKLINFCLWIWQAKIYQQNFSNNSPNQNQWALMWDMNVLFELWLSVKLPQVFAKTDKDFEILYQQNQDFVFDNEQKSLKNIRPDFVIKSAKKTVVIDAKWKNVVNFEQIAMTDLYQIIVYAEQVGAEEAWLVFPTVEPGRQVEEFFVKNQQIRFFIVPFDVNVGQLKI